ncbi:MAG: hypothetical protein ACR2GD_08725 [Pyrinomonadaceae bacterium]
MKIILLGMLCLFFGTNALAQDEKKDETDDAPVGVEQISLLRDDGAGKAGEETENFSTADKTLHFRIQLSSQKPALVKMILVAAEVAGLKPETKSVTVSYKTNGKQNVVNFTTSPEDAWLAGKYRADIFIDGKLAGKKEFEIQKTSQENEKEKQPPKTDAPPAPKPNRRTRKT